MILRNTAHSYNRASNIWIIAGKQLLKILNAFPIWRVLNIQIKSLTGNK
jgi:hypothetical protein